MQSTGEKQQFIWTNTMVELPDSLGHFKASMEYKGKYSDGDMQVQKLVLQKELCEKYGSFGTEQLLKTASDTDQTDLAARHFTIARQTSCIITFEGVIQWIANKLSIIVNGPLPFKKVQYRSSFLHSELSNIKTQNIYCNERFEILS